MKLNMEAKTQLTTNVGIELIISPQLAVVSVRSLSDGEGTPTAPNEAEIEVV